MISLPLRHVLFFSFFCPLLLSFFLVSPKLTRRRFITQLDTLLLKSPLKIVQTAFYSNDAALSDLFVSLSFVIHTWSGRNFLFIYFLSTPTLYVQNKMSLGLILDFEQRLIKHCLLMLRFLG